MTEQDLQNPNFNPGGIPHIPDVRDFQWRDIGSAIPPFDWSAGYDVETLLEAKLNSPGFKLPVKDQNGSGSCGGQATSQEDGVLEAFADAGFEERSAKYVIAQTFVLDSNGQMLGSRFKDNGDLVRNQGVSREALCPSYDNGQPPTDAFMNRIGDITEAARADAKFSKTKSYAYVSPTIDDFAQALATNFGMIMLLRGSNNGTWGSPFPQPGLRKWAHFMYVGKAKLINGAKFIGAINSWGKNIGENGWQWFGENYFASGNIDLGQTMLFADLIPPPPKYVFTRDLHIGSAGVDVKFLQIFLNAHNCPVADSGPGSPGHETSTFGILTQQALEKFQRDNAITPAFGYFGPLTRTKVNAMQ